MHTPTRGIVTSANIFYDSNTGSAIVSHRIDPLEIRQYLLYWDKIAWAVLRGPTSRIVNKGILNVDYVGPELGSIDENFGILNVGGVGNEFFGGDRDLRLLKEESIVDIYEVRIEPSHLSPPEQEPKLELYGFLGSQINEAVVRSKIQLLQFLNQETPRYLFWSLGHNVTRYGREILLRTDPKVKRKQAIDTIEIDIPAVLPVPTGEVPIEKILEFKRKREPELLRFRLALATLYDSIINAPDIRFRQASAVDEINLSLALLRRLMKESRIKRMLTPFTAILNIDIPEIIKILFATGNTILLKINPELLDLVKSVKAAVSIKRNSAPSLLENLPGGRTPMDYLYLFYIEREFGKHLKQGG